MSLNRYYKIAALYPSLFVMATVIIFSIIDNHDYKSEWLTADSVIFLSIAYAFVYCLIICGLSATIFLTRFEKIRTSTILTVLSWFLLPFSFIAIVFIHEISFRIKYESKFGDDFIYVLILNLPFVFGLIWSYLRYRKSISASNII